MKQKKLEKCWECGKLQEKFYCSVECAEKAMSDKSDGIEKLFKKYENI